MSALAGYWRLDGASDAAAACARMLKAQAMYGPHGEASADLGDIALGRRLFHLLPEDRFDRQPLTGGGGRYHLVADIRLDNRDELVAALGLQQGRELSDSDILLAAWERWQEQSLQRLAGDFAFALWDDTARKLFLARDHFGVRPLHYHVSPRFVAFASMPKGIHALPEISRAPDEIRGAEFLALLPEWGPRSFFENVCRVEAGKLVVISSGRVQTEQYWRPEDTELLRLSSFDDYVEGVRAHLDRAVASRLRGAGDQVAAHLSSGLDSSAVTATAARLIQAENGRVVAFTSAPRAGYDGYVHPTRIGDETALAATVASLYPNIEHVPVRSDGRSIMDDLDRDFHLFDRPLVNTDIQHWLNVINAKAKDRGLKVLLTAVMGNAVFSYDGITYLSELSRAGRFLELLRLAHACHRKGNMTWRHAILLGIAPWMSAPLWRTMSRIRWGWVPDVFTYTALNPERFEALDIPARAREADLDLNYRPRMNALHERLWILRRIDFGNNQKGVLAGWGVDLRDVTTDRRFVEFCLSIPPEMFLHGGERRALARAALADRLPAEIVNERRRGLQAPDWHEGLTAERPRLAEEVARLNNVPSAAAALDLPRMEALIRQWPTSGWNTPAVDMHYRQALMRAVASGHFFRRASGSNA